MNDRTADLHKNNALQAIRLFACDEEFVKQLFATLMASTDDPIVQRIALDAFMELDDGTVLPDLPTME